MNNIVLPLISIVVPVYNAASTLPKMLVSIINQTHTNWEVVIVNDGSTDDSNMIIEKYQKKNNKVKYFYQDNAGPSSARNLGISKAQGVYLAFIDADDWVANNYLESMLISMEKHTVDLVCAGYFELNKKNPKGHKQHDFGVNNQNKILEKQVYQRNLFKGVSGVLWAKLFKKKFFEINQIKLNPKVRLSEDLLVVLEYSKYIKNAFIIPENIYYYNRLNEIGLSRKMTTSNYFDVVFTNNEILKYRDELSFLNLEKITQQRLYSFLCKFLKDNSNTIQNFYKAAEFINLKIKKIDNGSVNLIKEDRMILTLVYSKCYYLAWLLISSFYLFRKIKHSFMKIYGKF